MEVTKWLKPSGRGSTIVASLINHRMSRQAYGKDAARVRDISSAEHAGACFHAAAGDGESQPEARFIDAVLPERLEHSLQCATLAHRDGKDDEYVVCALLHEIGDTLASYNHDDVAADILKPFVSRENLWMVQHHGIFQGYYFFHRLGLDRDMREKYRGEPDPFQRTEEFSAKYDGAAFATNADVLPLSFFEPMVREIFSRKPKSIYTSSTD